MRGINIKTEITKYNSLELFNYNKNKDKTFIYVTTRIDITNLYNLGKVNKSCYGTIGYYITLAMNEIDEFKYRYENDKIYLYKEIMPSYTQMLKDNTIGFFACPLDKSYKSFIKEFKRINKDFINNTNAFQNNGQDVVWLSCSPWFTFTGIITPYDKSISIPQVTWDKFTFEDNKCYINMCIMVHHGFVDGYHIGLFINELNKIISNIK